MIRNVEILNFKSIKHIKFDVKRVNIIIGEPNKGKSNILEAIGVYSPFWQYDLHKIVRFEVMYDLFFDQDTKEKASISIDQNLIEFIFDEINVSFKMLINEKGFYQENTFGIGKNGNFQSVPQKERFPQTGIKFFRFDVRSLFTDSAPGPLSPPNGGNLAIAILTNKATRTAIADFLEDFGVKLNIKQSENKIELVKSKEDVLISYPFSTISDTLQRMIFYFTAMETCEKSTLIFEEPESHAFPFYTKLLAESIGAFERHDNQYIISTHNPYFLSSVIEKTPLSELSVIVTYMEDYQTKIEALNKEEIGELLDLGPDSFFNLDKFIKKPK